MSQESTSSQPTDSGGADIVLFKCKKRKLEENPDIQEASGELSRQLNVAEDKLEKETTINKSKENDDKYEKSLRKWIDIDDGAFIKMCNLELLLSTYRSAPQTSVFLANLFSAKLPNQAEPLHRMVSDKDCDKEEFQVLACEYKDKLLNLIIFMLRKFLKDSEFIDDPSLNPQRHAIFVKRIKTIYRILTNYFIGGPNLSEKSEQDKFTVYTSKYNKLFEESPLVSETTSTSVPPARTGWSLRKAFESPFGLGFRGGSIKKRSRKSKRTRKAKGLYRG
jgi:hypothetical protein